MPTYREQVLADGAVLYMRLDEGSGNVVSLVGGYTGTVTGGVTRSQPGALADGNTAMLFDGTTGKITVASIAVPAIFTAEAWVKLPAGAASTYRAVVGNRTATPVNGEWLLASLNTSGAVLYASNPNTQVVGTPRVDDDSWHHIVGVSTGTDIIVYRDGIASAPIPRVIPPRTGALLIGADDGTGYGPQAAFIDEVAIYPTALTAPQIANHYALRLDVPLPAPYSFVRLPAADRPFNLWQPLTPSDQTDRPFASLWCGTAGTVAAVMQDGVVGAFTVPAGAIVPIMGRRVNSTGTSVTNILALGTV